MSGRRLRHVLVVIGLGTAARLLWVLVVHRPADFDYSDMHGYMEHARRFADARAVLGPADVYYPPGTSACLSLFLCLFGEPRGWTAAAAAQAVLSGVQVGLVYLAGRRFFGHAVSLWAAVALAADYLAMSYAGYFLSETWLSVVLAAALAAASKQRGSWWLLAGALVGLGACIKPQALLLAPLWALWLLLRRRRVEAFLALAGAMAIVVPASLVVSRIAGRPTFLSNNGGQTFALAHCPVRSIESRDPATGSNASFGIPVVTQRADRGELEASWPAARYSTPFADAGFYVREGVACIGRDPVRAVREVGAHAMDLFAGPPWSSVVPWPDAGTKQEYRAPAVVTNHVVSYFVLPLAMCGAWQARKRVRRRSGTWLLVFLPMLSLLAGAILFHGDPRFRVPYDACLFLAASSGVRELLRARPSGASRLVKRDLARID